METAVSKEKCLLLESETETTPATPSRIHKSKKYRMEDVDDVTNVAILEAVINLTKKFDAQEKTLLELSAKMDKNCVFI